MMKITVATLALGKAFPEQKQLSACFTLGYHVFNKCILNLTKKKKSTNNSNCGLVTMNSCDYLLKITYLHILLALLNSFLMNY